jgi:PAS domain S-box-containing protein
LSCAIVEDAAVRQGFWNLEKMKWRSKNADAWLAAIVESSDDAIISKDLDGIITSWNDGAERMFGYTADEMVGESILKLLPLDRRHEEEYILGQMRQGKRIKAYDTIRRCKDGRLLNVSLSVSPIRDENQTIVGASKIARDITEWKMTLETQKLLLRELNHRTKNLLAVADAIVRQTAKRTPPAELVNRVSRRLHALSLNQDLLVASDWQGAELSQLVHSQVEALLDASDARVSLEGPRIVVRPSVAQSLGMAIYELTANALKYGALSTAFGRVHILWSVSDVEGAREFRLSWRETGGPPPAIPKKRGFGRTIIEDMVARSVLGKASAVFAPTGYVWELVAPESALIEETAFKTP